MTETMKAVAYTRSLPIDDPASLTDAVIDVPTVRPRDLLVEVRAVSVNPVDVKVRAGNDPQGAPKVLGFDAAGVVRAVGADVTMFAPGDEVYYAGDIGRPGTNSQFHAVDERIVAKKPTTLDFAQAAALPLTVITAWEGLFDKLRITAETTGTLLMVGATGGVGSVVLQLVRALVPGVHVIATAADGDAVEWVRSLGAAEVVNHRRDLREEVRRVAPDGVDYVFTAHSSGQVEIYADLLTPFGQIVAIDDPETIDVLPLKTKAISWHWEFMFARPMHDTPDLIRQHELLTRVAELVDAGSVRTTVTTVLSPIDAEQLREAHRLVETGHVRGKVVIAARS
ncbi:zinc-binding alcohol dehydrogenase family protein [Rhodococcus sp. IEGM 1401]|uniref:zinc-binding alcohol dehydrogenase family protein n=1 Tax=unclassified Rhodococcus (in: high G+C Gram-positive bacteria) TaxID=192944 RepID=UPI0022B50DCA|nr:MULTISPECIES: zinc-binding alcohol dehydrogenase family protein [unclassified Rhodococcus (in: high G+C Gram-positive bacteria)]MCZ4559577.1 zinc-binding alcohol dehydrogenase family protein [Rhodococcus sp. IEGM 1401]MDI9919470.1 zinc-binding alcohol dehydrogenase family protein [Rhodococcus sp. IEGM 1372]MDV8032157.1 zinc-binding alcohol dehydrogenase family protein [Rhodococcus sp. IEGM 1414]